jgi:hypothetical protein
VCVCVCVCAFVLYCNTPENELTGEARAASNHIPQVEMGQGTDGGRGVASDVWSLISY